MENITVKRRGDAVVVTCDGEITMEITGPLKEKLEAELAGDGFALLVVDLSDVTFMDSSGIGFLVALSTRLKGLGGAMRLFRPSTQVRKTLELVQLSNFFHIVTDEDELEALLPD